MNNTYKEVSFGKIPVDWDITTIDNVKSPEKHSIAMGPFGSNIKAENYRNEGIPVIRGVNLNFDRYISGDFVFVNEEKAEQLKSSSCKSGDLVFTHRGTIGQVCLVPDNPYAKYIVSQSGMKLTVNKNIINNVFLFYFFKSNIGQYQILQFESQVGVPSISNPLTSLKSIEIPLPPLPEQKAIASVLGSLDDKIDLLQRENVTLEKMAETLFRQWFIEEAEEDWEEITLNTLFDIYIGRTPPRKEQWCFSSSYGCVWVSIKDMANDGIYISDSSEYLIDKAICEYHVPLIPKGSVLLSFKMTVGRVKITDKDMYSNEAIACFVKKDNQYITNEYLYLFLKQFNYDMLGSTSSIVTAINSTIIKNITIKIPNIKKVKIFTEIIKPLFMKIKFNQKQIQTLTKLRDTLLPKLMSGEIRVKVDE